MSDAIQIKVDASQIDRLGNLLGAAGTKAPQALMHAVNHTGDKAKNAMIRSLAPQTGLKLKVFRKALKGSKAFSGGSGGGGRSEYVIKSKGGNVALRFFKPKESGDGVNASPWNRSQHYAKAFTKVGGGFGKKKTRKRTSKFHGNVMHRACAGRYPLKLMKSGLDIPDEMVQGASRASFFSVVESDLMPRVLHELLRSIPG